MQSMSKPRAPRCLDQEPVSNSTKKAECAWRDSFLIAEPEKVILDWIYLGIQDGTAPALDELDFGSVDRAKLLNHARRFPSSTYLHVLPALVETAVPKSSLPQAPRPSPEIKTA